MSDRASVCEYVYVTWLTIDASTHNYSAIIMYDSYIQVPL